MATMSSTNPSLGLLSNEHAELLAVTNQLGRLGLGRHLELPQLVVCGDQSSGKSSVLQSISGVRFPVNEGLCTRFATKIVLHRSGEGEKETGSVSIEPGTSSSEEQKAKFAAFQPSKVNIQNVPALMEEATNIICPVGDFTLSDTTLRVELSGPGLPHLTLVDLPGLIHSTKGSQAKEDIKMIEALVRKYMKGERTVILVVLSAHTDASNQAVLELAREEDSDGRRTMGIITKPDKLDPDSEGEKEFLAYARNEEAKFGYGWHVVRNAGYSERVESVYDQQHEEEKEFSKRRWERFPKTSLGGPALITRLSKISFELERRELPKVVVELNNRIDVCRENLRSMGDARNDAKTQRLYLVRKAEKFQHLVRSSVAGHYDQEEFLKNTSCRLRAHVRHLTREFASAMRSYGHTYEINYTEDVTANNLSRSRQTDEPTLIAYNEYLKKIQKDILSVSAGQELPGTFNPYLVGPVFRQQSYKWHDIATRFADDVWATARIFVSAVVRHETDQATAQRLLKAVIEPAMSVKYDILQRKVEELLTPYTRAQPFSESPRFVEEVERMRDRLGPRAAKYVDDMHACADLFQCGAAYYRVALDTFVDNMATLAIENCVLYDLHELLSPANIAVMENGELEKLASESPETIAQRKSLNEQLHIFRESLLICRSYDSEIGSGIDTASAQFQRTTAGYGPDAKDRERANDTSSHTTVLSSFYQPEIRLPTADAPGNSQEHEKSGGHHHSLGAGGTNSQTDLTKRPEPVSRQSTTTSAVEDEGAAGTRTPARATSSAGTPSSERSTLTLSSLGSSPQAPRHGRKLSRSKVPLVEDEL